MATIRCDHCGAPLEGISGSRIVTCTFCKHEQTVEGHVEAVEAPRGTNAERYARGQAVLCEWRAKYWPATVLEVLPGDLYRIHYDGYSDSWDETVGLDRLAPRGSGVPKAPNLGRAFSLAVIGLMLTVLVGGALAWTALNHPTGAPSPTGGGGAAVGARSPVTSPKFPALASTAGLAPGVPLVVSWGGQFWNAEVVAVESTTVVRVHYVGWDARWDESVTIDRVYPR